ncbi:MAG: PDZ domain-containing protein [Rhodothermales bacterium]|nr:PDZ domain-containing protein [Rhodothermales bacterium]
MKFFLSIVCLLAFPTGFVAISTCAAQDDPILSFQGEQAVIPMPATAGRHLVQVRIGNAGPYAFLIDTGSTISAIDTQLAKSLGLKIVGEILVGAPGGEQVAANRVSMLPVTAGDLLIEHAEMVAIDLVEMTNGLMEGILGMDLFRELVLTYDPQNERAVVSREHLRADDPSVVKIDSSGGGVNAAISVAGRKVMAHFDSGSPGGVTLPLDMMDGLPLASGPSKAGKARLVGGERSLLERKLEGAVKIGTLEYVNPTLTFMDPSAPFANIGSKVLDELLIVIDQRSRLLSIKEAEPRQQADQAAPVPRRLGVRFRGSPGGGLSEIAGVDPGSPGEQAGFEVGDRVVSLNERSISEYDQQSLGQLIRGPSDLTWVVERAGERLTIVVR